MIQGSYRNMKTKFQDFSRIIQGHFQFSRTQFNILSVNLLLFLPEMEFWKKVTLHFYHRNIFIMVPINTGLLVN